MQVKKERIAVKADPADPEDFDVSEAGLAAALAERRARRGRPVGSTKKLVSIRLDQDVIAKFKAGGPGWQSRINEALRRAHV